MNKEEIIEKLVTSGNFSHAAASSLAEVLQDLGVAEKTVTKSQGYEIIEAYLRINKTSPQVLYWVDEYGSYHEILRNQDASLVRKAHDVLLEKLSSFLTDQLLKERVITIEACAGLLKSLRYDAASHALLEHAKADELLRQPK